MPFANAMPTLRFVSLLCLLAALSACRTSRLGACSKDVPCPEGTSCDPAGYCVANAGTCLPACDAAHVCVSSACQPAPAVAITSPAPNAFLAGTLQATANATAADGVASVRFDLSRGGVPVASATAAPAGGATSFSASIPLASVADGAATLTATVTATSGAVAKSAPVPVAVDQTPPSIVLQTDGRAAFYGAGQTATFVAQITGAVSGVQDATVQLLLAGHPPVTGVPGASGTYSFAVPVDDSIVAAGGSAALPFQIVAANKAGVSGALSGNAGEVLQADRDAPSIASVSYTPAALAGPSGHQILGGPSGGAVLVQATLADFSGVGSACLRLPGETAACQHPGAQLAGSTTWTFSLPRPAPPQDGSAATSFTLEAADTVAAGLSGASQAEHLARSLQTVYFDYGPSVSVLPDTTPYARTDAGIPVGALVTSTAGVPDGGVFLNGTLPPSSRDGGLFLFQLDPRSAPANVEGAYFFQVSATDSLGVSADAGGFRIVDDAAPDASVRVFKGTLDPLDAGVFYPPLVAGTGWDGSHFVYSDTVQVNGTLTDVSGISSASLHIDYVQPDGGTSAGTPQALTCPTGGASCTFAVSVALDAPSNGRFNTVQSKDAMGDLLAPAGNLKIVIDSTDAARSASNLAAPHSGAKSNDARTTRLLWQMYLPASVSGLGVHPNGDLIVTLDGGTDTVVALRPDDGGVNWSFGGAAGLGAITGTPAIGAGDGSSALVYVAGYDGGVFALHPDGGEAWRYSTGDKIAVGPALSTAAGAVDEVLVDGALKTTSSLYNIAGGALLSSATVSDANTSSAPLVLSGSVYYGTASSIARHTLNGAGALGSATSASTLFSATYFEVITDGTDLFAWRNFANGLVSANAALSFNWAQSVTPTGAPSVRLGGAVVAPLASGAVDSFAPAKPGTPTLLLTLGGPGLAPLIGWDGNTANEHYYFPRQGAGLFAYDASGNESWEAGLVKGTAYRASTMDCSGRLFAASSGVSGSQSLVYALVTDDRGLANTAWPSYRLDARNTGNATATSGIFTGTCTQ